MGSRTKLVLASLVSLTMMLAFAIGLVPSQETASLVARAAAGGSGVAISVDGATPVGNNFAIPVGSEQGFTALSDVNGQAAGLIPVGAAEWSLHSDGSAALRAVPGDLVATVSALSPGEAGLYVATGDGLVDMVNLSLYSLKQAKQQYLSQVRIIRPRNGSGVLFQEGTTGHPLTARARTDSFDDTMKIDFSLNDAPLSTDTTLPYTAQIPDVSTLVGTNTLSAVATSNSGYGGGQATSTFTVRSVNADTNGDGLPDDIFALDLGFEEIWVSSVDQGTGRRLVVVAGFPTNFGKQIEVPDEGLEVTIEDPDEPSRVVVVTVPAGLANSLAANEEAYLIVETADTLTALLGTDEAADVAPVPAGGLVEGGQYTEISVLVSSDGGTTFAEIDEERLAANPVIVEQYGLTVTGDTNARYFSYPTSVIDTDNGEGTLMAIDALNGFDWLANANGTELGVGVMRAELTSLSVVAPFNTPNAVRITGVTALSTNYSSGGAELEVTVENLDSGSSFDINVDGLASGVQDAVFNGTTATLTVVAPEANPLATPAASAAVNLSIQNITPVPADGLDFDTRPRGVTYVGPAVTAISPDNGEQTGGTDVTVTGEGFTSTVAVSLGGAPLTGTAVAGGTTITGTTSPASPGVVDVTVTNSNNYVGSLAQAFAYTQMDPVLTSINPTAVYDDGGYKIRINGMGFLDPTAKLISSVENLVYFTRTAGAANPGTDDLAWAVEYRNGESIDAITPERDVAPGTYEVYVVTRVSGGDTAKAFVVESQPSNLIDIEFLDAGNKPFTIDAIVPSEGPITGGNEVEIQGTDLPEGGTTGGGAVCPPDITTGQVLRVACVAQETGTVGVNLYLFRGDDVVREEGNSPAAINGTISFDPTVLTPTISSGTSVFVTQGTNLNGWYSKELVANNPASGQVTFVISGSNQNEMTTFDDQKPNRPDPPFNDPHDPNDQENPFFLGTIFFDVAGSDGAISDLEVSGLTMANGDAVALTNASAQNGVFRVGTTLDDGGEPTPGPRVFFGPNEATVLSTKATSLRVTAPAGDRLGAVDVRVVDGSNASLFAVHRAYNAYEGGYTYVDTGCPIITGVTPSQSWLFGGVVAHLQGANFQYVSAVRIGGELAQIANIDGLTNDDNNLYVIVPAYTGTIEGDSETVSVTVEGSGTCATFTLPGAFTYVRTDTRTEARPGVSGEVTTTAFYFDGTAPSGEIEFDLSSTETGTVAFPQVLAASKQYLGNLVLGLIRATKTPDVFGLDQITAGDRIADAWAFDIHLYDGQYPFNELTVNFDRCDSPAVLAFPVGDTTLAEADVQDGGVSMYSVDTDLDFTNFNNMAFTVVPNSAEFQSNVLDSEFNSATSVVSARLAHLSAFELRNNAPAPDMSLDAISPNSGPTSGGTTVTITGEGLGHPTEVLFGTNAVNPADITVVSECEITVLTPASATEGAVDVTVTTAAGTDTLVGAFTYTISGVVIASVSPDTTWVFGGEVATLTGSRLDEAESFTFVTSGGAAEAQILSATDTEAKVVVPPMPGFGAGAEASRLADIVATDASNNTSQLDDAFTYVRYQTDTTANGDVTTTAFFFDPAAASSEHEVVLPPNTTAQAFLDVPQLATVAKAAAVRKNTQAAGVDIIAGVARASKSVAETGTAFGNIGTAIDNIWTFDLHLYEQTDPTPTDGRTLQAKAVKFNTPTAGTKTTGLGSFIELSYPVTDTTTALTIAEATQGRYTTWGRSTALDYTYANPVFTQTPTDIVYQSVLLRRSAAPGDYDPRDGAAATALTRINARLYDLGTTGRGVALRRNAGLAPLVDETPLGGAQEGGFEGGDDVTITGEGLAWIDEVLFDDGVAKVAVPATIVTQPGTTEFELVVTSPQFPNPGNVNRKTVDIVVNFPNGSSAVLPDAFTYTKQAGPRGAGLLAAALAALIGLLAGDSGGGGGGPCFIATAAYGTPMAEQIDTLRAVRDEYLLTNAAGTAFVDAYYRVSPAIADVVAQSPVLAATVRALLIPVVWTAKLVLAMPHVSAALGLLGLVALLRRRKASRAKA